MEKLDSAMDAPLISIIVVNYNGADLLGDCLSSLRLVDYANYEVVVVDNASTDNSMAVLARFPSVKVVRSDRNLGFTGGNNLGLVHCRGQFVLLLNNDTIVNRDFLGTLSNYLQTHPEVGIVQGKMVLPKHAGTLDTCGSFLTPFGFLYHYGYFKPDGPKYQANYPVFSGKGACLLFRRELVDRVGGYLFDENLFCYYEETDFCHRAWIAGFETHFVSSAAIQHLMGATADKMRVSDFPLRQYLRNQTFCLLSNLSAGSLVRIIPVYFLIFFSSMAAALLKGKLGILRAHWFALVFCARNLGRIRAQRRIIARIRVLSDALIWSKVMRMPRLEYFWKTFTGSLGEYADDVLSNCSAEKTNVRADGIR